MDAARARRSARTAGLLIGMGMGGFVDGWALHQIAQWHNMLSARLPPHTMEAMRVNMTADGWFHAGVWTVTLVGILLLWRTARHPVALPSTRWLIGVMLAGWGVFNLVEGIVDHHLLELHHVRDEPVHMPLYDWVFLAVGGVGFVLLGWLLTRGEAGVREGASPRSHTPGG